MEIIIQRLIICLPKEQKDGVYLLVSLPSMIVTLAFGTEKLTAGSVELSVTANDSVGSSTISSKMLMEMHIESGAQLKVKG